MKHRAPHAKPRKRREKNHGERPSQLRLPTLLVILATGAVATTMGVMLVGAQFQARDYEMEARRLQELSRERRDEVKKLQTRLGGMKRSETLREAAMGPLGMIEPHPADISQLDVDPALITEFERAEEFARQNIAAERERLEMFRKDGD